MSLKTNKLRKTDPTKLLLARAASGKGVVLDNGMAQKVAASLVIESMKVESLVGQLGTMQRYAQALSESLNDEDLCAALWEQVTDPAFETDEEEAANA